MNCDFEAGSPMHKNRTNEMKKNINSLRVLYDIDDFFFLHWICYWNICNNDEEQWSNIWNER